MKEHPRLWALALVLLVTCLVGRAHAQTAPALTFSLQTTSPDGKTLVPKLVWSTSPLATSCTASGDWSGPKSPANVQTLAAVSSAKAYTLSCTWPGDTTATISWVSPTTNSDGSALAKCATQTDTGGCLRSVLVLRGSDATSVGMDSKPVDDRNATSYVWSGLTEGTHWFSVVAVNGDGIMSAQAVPPASKVITAASTVSRTMTLGFSIPAAPASLTVK